MKKAQVQKRMNRRKVTKSCYSHEVIQKSQSYAKVTKSCKSHEVMQKSRIHAKVMKSCTIHEVIQKSQSYAKVTKSCKSHEVMQKSRIHARVTKSSRSHEDEYIFTLSSNIFGVFSPRSLAAQASSEQVSVGAESGGGLESNLGLVVDGLPHQLDLRFRPNARIMHRFHPAYGMLRNWIDVVRPTKGE